MPHYQPNAQYRVEIEGAKIEKVCDVQLGFDVGSTFEGQPQSDRPKMNAITIIRKSDQKTDFWDWATSTRKPSWKKGSIVVKDANDPDKTLKTIKWEDGYLSSYEEVLPNVHTEEGEPMVEIIHISARVVDFDGVRFEEIWH